MQTDRSPCSSCLHALPQQAGPSTPAATLTDALPPSDAGRGRRATGAAGWRGDPVRATSRVPVVRRASATRRRRTRHTAAHIAVSRRCSARARTALRLYIRRASGLRSHCSRSNAFDVCLLRRVLFLSDESIAKSGDGLSKSVGWSYSDFSLHATSLSRTNWPHQFLLAKLNGPEDDNEHDNDGDEQKGEPKAAKVWTRRCARGDGDDSDGGQYSDEEDSSAVAATTAAAASAPADVMYDRVVEELRFVPPKPAEQRQCSATQESTASAASEGNVTGCALTPLYYSLSPGLVCVRACIAFVQCL